MRYGRIRIDVPVEAYGIDPEGHRVTLIPGEPVSLEDAEGGGYTCIVLDDPERTPLQVPTEFVEKINEREIKALEESWGHDAAHYGGLEQDSF